MMYFQLLVFTQPPPLNTDTGQEHQSFLEQIHFYGTPLSPASLDVRHLDFKIFTSASPIQFFLVPDEVN